MNFTDKTLVIVCHDSVFGPPHELRDYLNAGGARKVLLIGHQNRYVSDNPVKASYYERYERGKRIGRHQAGRIRLPEPVAYIRDFLLTVWWTVRFGLTVDEFIGLGNLNAIAGLLLKSVGLVRNVRYYVIDYIPQRFPNRFLNSFYHRLDRICALRADSTWNYAPAMIQARNEHWHTQFPRQLVVPNGIHIRPELIEPFAKIHRYELIYLGTLYEQQGIQLVIEALPAMIKKMPDVTFTLIGQGPYRKTLEDMARKLKVTKHIRFLGYIADPLTMEKRLAKGAIGVGMYKPRTGFVAYTEPGKIKRYLAVGVPVVMTGVSPIAKDLIRAKCGLVLEYEPTAFAAGVVSLLRDDRQLQKYRTNAIAYARGYEWASIFDRAFRNEAE